MKFLCDNCKAKYQIGDDKVAGKTVRMKCRRCGHLIQVSASVTESSVARRLPTEDGAAHEAGAGAAASPKPAPAAAAPVASAKPEHPGSILENEEENEERTVMMTRPSQLPGKPEAPRPVVAFGAKPQAHAPAPRPAAGAPPRPGAAAPRAASAGVRPLRAVPSPVPAGPPPARLERALARAVAEPAPSVPASRHPTTHSEDWYVGVAGVPLGPIRLSVIREKAATGAVDADSLVWREGFDEWLPLKNFPELLEVVNEARTSAVPGRRSSISQRLPTPHGLSAPPAGRSASKPAPFGESGAAAAAAAAASLASTSHPTPAPVDAAPAAPATSASAPGAVAPSASIGLMADPFAPAPGVPAAPAAPSAPAAMPVAVAVERRPSTPPDSLVASRRRGGMHPMAYAFIAMAAVFGGVAAFVLLTPKAAPPPPPQIVVLQPAGPAPPPPPTAVAEGADAGAAQVVDPAAPPPKVGGPLAGGPRAPGDPKTPGTSAPIDTSGFGVGSGPGPAATAPPGGPGPSAGGQLSSGEINGVVSQNQALIRRRCWQPALDAASKSGPKSAKVSTTITIGASGNVDNVSAGGGDAFPGLASCIASRIKGWKFPPSGGSTTVNVPFSFVEQ